MELRDALIEVAQHGKELIKGDGHDAGVESGDERLVVDVEAMEDIRDQLVILDGFSGGGEFIDEAAQGGEVGGDRLVALLRVDERSPDVVDAAEGLGREHARQGHPWTEYSADSQALVDPPGPRLGGEGWAQRTPYRPCPW